MAYAGGGYSNGSDPRLKCNITDAGEALPVLKRIPVKAFDWIADMRHWNFGFLAPELSEIDPAMAFEPKNDNEYWGVNSFYLVGVLVKAVQELAEEVERLREG